MKREIRYRLYVRILNKLKDSIEVYHGSDTYVMLRVNWFEYSSCRVYPTEMPEAFKQDLFPPQLLVVEAS